MSTVTIKFSFREQLMALIGEQFDDTEEICGVVVSVRQRQDKLALWTRNASNEALQVIWESTFKCLLSGFSNFSSLYPVSCFTWLKTLDR